MTVVLDASAVLAWAQGEPGAARVRAALGDSLIPATAWAEVAQKAKDHGADWAELRSTIRQFGAELLAVDDLDAEEAAALWRRGQGLSLADRFCIAVGRRLDLPIWTCDQAWAVVDPRVVVLR